ncbi:hypothetical protein KL86PLE_90067 [uncultured Pleomorphomonas sp.]|uniref:Uncharacterized protein n=1 Tax=uncultured Pleomorphomonas sp. TaxID=442121 RepID=A0A212LMK1_9HYPH|nr:hypothetical protein KL86PLE_90067 [uncultured Pleomorphomonas sp.]
MTRPASAGGRARTIRRSPRTGLARLTELRVLAGRPFTLRRARPRVGGRRILSSAFARERANDGV